MASCLPLALNSGVQGRGTDRQVRSSEDKDERSLAGHDWLNCPDGSPQTPVTPLTGKLPRGAWEGGFLMASSPGPENMSRDPKASPESHFTSQTDLVAQP